MGIDLLRTFTEERTTNRHVVYFMTFLVMIEKAAEGRREGLNQAHSLRTYSIVVVKDRGRSVKEHEEAGRVLYVVRKQGEMDSATQPASFLSSLDPHLWIAAAHTQGRSSLPS